MKKILKERAALFLASIVTCQNTRKRNEPIEEEKVYIYE